MVDKYYVYMFINWDWNEPFYIGKGSNNRWKDIKNRSLHVARIWSTYNCTSHIIKYCDSESEAYDLEQYYKEYYIQIGAPIIDGEKPGNKLAQRVGIEKAKAEGKFKGRKPVEKPINFESIYTTWKNGGITAVKAMSELGLKKTTFYKLVKDFEKDTKG